MPDPLVFGIRYSPWTEKALWALDLRRVQYRYREHVIMLGMPELRWRLGRWTGPLTVPALRDGAEILMDSWDIALYAEKNGAGDPLFPPQHLERIRELNALSERSLEAARVTVTAKLLHDPEAKVEVLPHQIPLPVRKVSTWIASLGAAYVAREFGYSKADVERSAEILRDGWKQLGALLKSAGGGYLLDRNLTYADIAMAVTLQVLEPARSGPRLGAAYRRCWTTPDAIAEFQGLLEWRDRLYDSHRKGAL